jgi:hypothetical protein
MYPTDLIYPLVFSFTATNTIIPRFDELGFSGTNFIELTGSTLINIIIAIILLFTFFIFKAIAFKFYKYKIVRHLGMLVPPGNFY